MIRILLLLVLAWLLYLILRQFLSSANAPKKAATNHVERFIQCSQCGCHTPELEAQTHADLLTCTNVDCINSARQSNVNKTKFK